MFRTAPVIRSGTLGGGSRAYVLRFQLSAWTSSELRGLDHHHVSAWGLCAPGYYCVLLLLLPQPEEEPEARQER